MKLYAWIDKETILTTIDKISAPEIAQEFNVDHEDQLIIVNERIIVDKNQEKKVDIIKNYRKKLEEKNFLEKEIINFIIKKELDQYLGTNYLNTSEYSDKLQKYQQFLSN